MPRHLMLRQPSANRVYAGESAALTAAELELTCPFASEIAETRLAGVSYLGFEAPPLRDEQLAAIASQSACYALFTAEGDLLRPVALPRVDVLDDDLVTIPKYQGKTNEQFTRLLMNVTLAAVIREATGARQILDPLCGRGTTLSTALIAGHDAYGVEADTKAFEQLASFTKTWLRRKRIKHNADVTGVRREGKAIGKRFDATIHLDQRTLHLTAFTGDTRSSADLFGKKKFDAIVTDAPYGVVHGSDGIGGSQQRTRTPAALLAESIPVWARQLMHGGALGISWNTLGLSREDLAATFDKAGLIVCEDGAWEHFAHRVDSSIRRDIMVGIKP